MTTSLTLEEQKDALGFEQLIVDEKIAKVSIVGAGMMSTPGVATKMFEALYDANINIQMINTHVNGERYASDAPQDQVHGP